VKREMAKGAVRRGKIAGGRLWNLPYPFLLALSLVVVVGLVTLYSASNGRTFFYRQLLWTSVGLSFMFLVSLVDLRRLERYCHSLYLAGVGLLFAVCIMGKVAKGAQRWIHFGPVGIQPSELVKLALVIALARVLMNQKDPFTFKDLWKPALLGGVPFVLTLIQPDLGTALIILGITGVTVLVKGMTKRTLVALLTLFVIFGVVGGPFVWSHLKGYQKRRIKAFLDPQSMAREAGYHVLQSQTAIGSGKVWGKGFRKGSQARLEFLPEEHTDFIFSVYAEERGFVGVVILLLLYFVLIALGLIVATAVRDAYSFFVVIGVITIYSLHLVINVGMTMGLLPVVGVPLPFMSYGGSSLFSAYLGAGLILAAYRRRLG